MKSLLFACVAALFSQVALAGGAVTAFEPGKPLPPEALRNVEVKAVVAEFLDPDRTQLGKELGYLVWREILTAVSDQRGAGVIIAHPPGEERLVDLLQQSYHEAALQVAQSQSARMAVWGALSEVDGRVVIDTYLSLVGSVTRDELALKLTSADSPGHMTRDTGFMARISRTRFNFPRVWTTRAALFERSLLVQVDTDVRERAGAGRTLVRARANETLQADGMEGEWFRVRLLSGGHGYVNSWNMYVPPRQIDTMKEELLFAQPAVGTAMGRKAAANATYKVLASRYVPQQGLWYRIATPTGEGWVLAYRVRTRFSLPVVHFAAGLYRYQLGRYDLAAREFEQYTRFENVSEDAPSLSAAYQLLGASELMYISTSLKALQGAPTETAFRAFDKAIAITPFDPNAYALRAVSTLATRHSVSKALPDVIKALEYDPDNLDARNALGRLQGISLGKSRLQEGLDFYMEMSDRSRIEELSRKYYVTPN